MLVVFLQKEEAKKKAAAEKEERKGKAAAEKSKKEEEQKQKVWSSLYVVYAKGNRGPVTVLSLVCLATAATENRAGEEEGS